MKLLCLQIAFLLSLPVFAQEQSAAEAELARLKELAAVGAIAPARVREAEALVADARDEAVLRNTLYAKLGPEEFSEQQAKGMLAAAQRLIDRQQERVSHERGLIEAGVQGKLGLEGAEQDLANRRKTLELARSRAKLVEEIADIARTEAAASSVDTTSESSALTFTGVSQRFNGNGAMLTPKDIRAMTLAWEKEFAKPMPVSARGETAVHRALGFDHRGRIDVAVAPDSTEGKWLREYLAEKSIPYFAFRAAIAGRATAPHIHVGPESVASAWRISYPRPAWPTSRLPQRIPESFCLPSRLRRAFRRWERRSTATIHKVPST